MKAERKVFRREVLHFEEVEYHCCGQVMDLVYTRWSEPPLSSVECSICGNIEHVPHGEGGLVTGQREEVK